MPAKKKISEKADKRRRAKVVVGHDADGEPIIKYASGRTKAELEANKEELIKTYIGGQSIDRAVTFSAYATEWVKTYKSGDGLSEGSKSNYRSVLKTHLIPEFGERQLRAITHMDIQRFMNEKATLKKSSIGYINAVIQHVFERATAEGILDKNPALGVLKSHASGSTRRALTDDEIAATLDVGASHPNGLLLLVLYYTGLRKGEAAGLRWSDIDFKNGLISIDHDYDFKTNCIGPTKSAASVRTVPMPESLSSVLKDVRGIGDAFIFQWLYTGRVAPVEEYSQAWDDLSKALVDARPSIESEDGHSILTAHYYRHNYASILYNAGVDVLTAQRWLGHANASTTLAIYSHLSREQEMKNASKLLDSFEKVAKRLPDAAPKQK